LAQPEQEPVAWEQFYPDIGKPQLAYLPPTNTPENACYTTAPAAQRTWVDLTPQDLNEVFKNANTGEGAVHLALEKFKEKNT